MDHNTAQKDDYRIIFDEDYKSRKSKAQPISIIKEQVAKIIEEDPFLRAKKQDTQNAFILLITNSIYIAQSRRTELSIDVSENRDTLSIFFAYFVMRFEESEMIALSHMCFAAQSISLVSGDSQNKTALLQIEYKLSDGSDPE